jgi:hypothetical protein
VKETELYEQVSTCMPGDVTRIENAISSGIFDMYWCYSGSGHWIEGKIRKGNRIFVRGTQYIWALRQIRSGMRNLWFLVMRDADDVPELYWANSITEVCDLKKTDGKGHLVVDISKIEPVERGWVRIALVLNDWA